MSTTITVPVTGRVNVAQPLQQYSTDLILQVTGVTLPASCEMHFSNAEHGPAVTVTAADGAAAIPDELLLSGANVYVWFAASDGAGGQTEVRIIFPVLAGSDPGVCVIIPGTTPLIYMTFDLDVSGASAARFTIKRGYDVLIERELEGLNFSGEGKVVSFTPTQAETLRFPDDDTLEAQLRFVLNGVYMATDPCDVRTGRTLDRREL